MYLYIKLHIHKQYLKLTPLSFHKDTEDVFLETVNFYKSIYWNWFKHWIMSQSDPAQNVAATWQPVNIKATHDEDADRNGAQSHKWVLSYGHLLVITGYKWDYTFYKWSYKYL